MLFARTFARVWSLRPYLRKGDYNNRRNCNMITKEMKQEIMTKYARTEGDTGSPEVQVALLTARINDLLPDGKAEP